MKLFTPGRDQSTQAKIKNIVFAFVVNFVWLIFISSFLKAIMTEITDGGLLDYKNDINESGGALFFFGCVLAPVWEEAAFRYAPITLARHFGKDTLLPVIILSSALFGWGHGSGPISLCLQGVSGLIICWVYIKNNYSYVSSTVSHFLWNFNLMFFLPYVFKHT